MRIERIIHRDGVRGEIEKENSIVWGNEMKMDRTNKNQEDTTHN